MCTEALSTQSHEGSSTREGHLRFQSREGQVATPRRCSQRAAWCSLGAEDRQAQLQSPRGPGPTDTLLTENHSPGLFGGDAQARPEPGPPDQNAGEKDFHSPQGNSTHTG